MILNQAIISRASDIHIEPTENDSLIRLRVDGELFEMKKLPKKLHLSLVSRIKVIGKMDIAESRIPQDGQADITMDDKAIQLRISSLPTMYGENIVIRILNKSSVVLGLEQLGFVDKDLQTFSDISTSPYGMILVTGPTGSGKTTTLYAALNQINTVAKNIITLEDPVEYQLNLIRQVQVNPKAGLTFANGLRSILRQDPDIILVGEIRDLETAELAVRSALTGHLVLSTLHTNDAPSTLIRLIDMGVEPFLVSSSLIAIMAQRLVRKICHKCKIKYKPPKEALIALNLDENDDYYKGKGCKQCNHKGYQGRIGIFELLLLNEEIKQAMVKRISATELRQLAINSGMVSLKEDGIRKIKSGQTTPEEVLKATEFFATV
jgi:type IV pilus assembly protein PilB